MHQLPDGRPLGQPLTDQAAKEQARQIANAVDEVLTERATFHRDDNPVPVVGTAPPVPQPGRPPMSQGATDASVLMIAGAGSLSMISLSAGVLMYLSQYADPVVCGIVFGAPTAAVLALARLLRGAKEVVEAAPPEIHHHYNGPVDQRTVQSKSVGVWAKTTNKP